MTATRVGCTSGSAEDAVETTAAGGTSLRYDATAGRFVYNWKTPAQAGQCLEVTVGTRDGSNLTALFRLT
ncbi:PxKF domain-containing protein [Cellulomonas marina]|uniref:Uncharacterized protein n=1 Tax=Cellulomonas marina TaxID=988821 RepID=A0A1I1ANK2_9CELL|nr:PxKF domain-containing protein [Cellulomonas marina]GIG30131.1 hypothetical protein Cma02nite_27310 [Cellulomonas marina]SFB37960.1 hypothetical protein SAMN05421867_1198 [Cellulomonas marina]